MSKIQTHRDLKVYAIAFDAAMRVFELSKHFPKEETYSLTDQIRRSSRSVCANIAEAWRKRRYEAAFVSKLIDCEREAAETQTWLEFAVHCKSLSRAVRDVQRRPRYSGWHANSPRNVGHRRGETSSTSEIAPSPCHPLTLSPCHLP